MAIAGARVALACLLLVVADLRGVLREVGALTGRSRLRIVGAGALLAAHFAFFQLGLDATSLPAAISLVSLEPLSVVLFAWAIQGVRPTLREQIGVAVATAGALLVTANAGTGEHRLVGDLCIVAAVFFYGAYLSAARGFTGKLHPRRYAALVYGGAAVALALALPFVPARTGSVVWPPPIHSMVAVLLLALVPTMIGHTTVQSASQRVSPALVALVSPLETLGGLAIAAVALGARPSLLELGGALAIVAGVVVAVLGVPSSAPRSSSV